MKSNGNILKFKIKKYKNIYFQNFLSNKIPVPKLLNIFD